MGIVTVDKLENADKDADALDTFINGADTATVTTRKSKKYPTLANAVKQVIETGGFEPFTTESALLASRPAINKKAAKALDTKKVWLWDGSKWNDTGLSEYDLAKNYTDSKDQILINKGKDYPFKKMIRNGIESQSSNVWNNFILDVKVNNADPSKYYQIAYQQNGALLNNSNKYNWIIYEFDRATFATNSVAVLVVATTDEQPQIIPNGTIQTVELKSSVRKDLVFTITCDTASLPIYNTPINSTTNTLASWSYIISESCYVYSPKLPTRSWLYDKGEYYPFLKASFKNIESAVNTTFLNCIKDIQVENAEEGYYYSLGYYTNGSTALGANYQERWIINKRAISNYSDATATETQIVSLTIPQQTLKRTGKVETVALVSTGKEVFYITVDTAQLPSYGFYISALSGGAGYSWYINSANYKLQVASSATAISNSDCYLEYTASNKSFKYRYKSKDKAYEIGFGLNGANSLPNFKSISTNSSNDLTGSFTTVQTTVTDWLPPLIFYAVNNPDADSRNDQFTGGNHASNGNETGDRTAENELFTIFVDGKVLDMSKDLKTYCKRLDIKIVNKLMASNTKTSKRYCLRQIFDMTFDGSAISVYCKLKALEAIKFRSDYALQCTTSGFNETQLILSGKDVSRVAFDGTSGSGPRTDYPNAFALILKGSAGILASWMDRDYGNGKPENCAPTQQLIRGGGASATAKYYQCAFRSYGNESTFPELSMNTTTEYKWRGGYVIQSDNSDSIYDSILQLNQTTSVIDANTYF